MSKYVKIKKGVNIKLKGTPEKVLASISLSDSFAIKPSDFHGITPKLLVKEGDEVKAGTPLFHDKYNEKVKFTSPVSGQVVEIKRGAKRRIEEVKVRADKEISYVEFSTGTPGDKSRKEIIDLLLDAGLWPFIKQRPYDIIANPEDTPKAIFISAFDSSPLAPDNDFIVHGKGEIFQLGLDAIAKLTEGKVHLNVRAGVISSRVFTNSKLVQLNKISGPHPSGNVGIQIHHIDPINKGEKLWCLKPQDVLAIGRFFKEGRFNAERIVALGGSQVKKPRYFRTLIGASITNMLEDNINEGNHRYISGNVLTGSKISAEGYLGFYDTQVTVIPEGDKEEFFGWIMPGFKKFSLSRSFFSWLTPNKKYNLDTNLHGEERPFVMSGQYESVFPMDIYPVHLVKSMMIGDIELMEKLGIYEVAPEDFALCEFACTSKIDVQEIVREGLDLVNKECG